MGPHQPLEETREAFSMAQSAFALAYSISERVLNPI